MRQDEKVEQAMITGQVISLNLGMATPIDVNGRKVMTGIFKSPVSARTSLSPTGFAGDQQADLRVHGGPQKAVYTYPSEHYEFWREKLHWPDLPYGAFGENLTTSGLLEDSVAIGDRFQVGSTILQVSQPRMPCFKLALRFGRSEMVKDFWVSGRPGIYFSVVQTGEIGPGDGISQVARGAERVTVNDVVRLYQGIEWSAELRSRALRAPLFGGWKSGIRERLTEQP
jgi:MOSC domain-containing protein YiiM